MLARWLVVVGVLTASLSGYGDNVRAASQNDEQINLSKYDTFFMMKGNSTGDAARDERLTADVKSALMSKGWVELAEGAGQAAVIVHVATSEQHTDEAFYKGWGGWNWRWNAPGSPARSVEDYKIGTVVVTIFDADTKQAVWRGFAADALPKNPKDADKVHDTAVARIFAHFPPAR